MAKFPPGDWGNEDFVDVSTWAEELRTLEQTRSLRSAIIELKRYSAAIAEVSEPLQFDDEEPSDDDDHEKAVASAPSAPSKPSTSIVVRSKKSATALSTGGDEQWMLNVSKVFVPLVTHICY